MFHKKQNFHASIPIKKIISFFVAFTFIFTNHFDLTPLHAQTKIDHQTTEVVNLNLLDLKIPHNLGKLEESWVGDRNKMVVLVQDAHAIPQAQKNIRNIIDFFNQKYGVNHVAIEGAASKLNTQIFRSFPDAQILKKVFAEYLHNGDLTGATMASVFNKNESIFEGVEDWKLYQEGYSYYLEGTKQSEMIKKKLKEWDDYLQEMKAQIYSESLRQVDESMRQFRRNEKDLLETIKVLSAFKAPSKDGEIDLVLQESLKETGTHTEIEKEVQLLAKKVKKVLAMAVASPDLFEQKILFNEKYQAYQTARISVEDFALFLKKFAVDSGLPIQVSRELALTIKKQKRIKDIEGTRFFDEFEAYVASVKESLFQNEKERSLDEESRHHELIEKLNDLELTQKQWVEFKGILANQKRQVRKLANEVSAAQDYFSSLLLILKFHILFYDSAEKRDAVFTKKLMAILDRQLNEGQTTRSTLFVAGGFHTEGLLQRFKEQGISYALVTPAIDSLPDEIHYKDQMQGKVSWQDYFDVENGKINVYKAFVRSTRDRIMAQAGDRVGALLKQWRDQIIRDLADKNQLTDTEQYTMFIDEVADGTGYENPQVKLKKKIDLMLDRMAELESQNQLTQKNIMALLKPSTIQAFGVLPINTGVSVVRDASGAFIAFTGVDVSDAVASFTLGGDGSSEGTFSAVVGTGLEASAETSDSTSDSSIRSELRNLDQEIIRDLSQQELETVVLNMAEEGLSYQKIRDNLRAFAAVADDVKAANLEMLRAVDYVKTVPAFHRFVGERNGLRNDSNAQLIARFARAVADAAESVLKQSLLSDAQLDVIVSELVAGGLSRQQITDNLEAYAKVADDVKNADTSAVDYKNTVPAFHLAVEKQNGLRPDSYLPFIAKAARDVAEHVRQIATRDNDDNRDARLTPFQDKNVALSSDEGRNHEADVIDVKDMNFRQLMDYFFEMEDQRMNVFDWLTAFSEAVTLGAVVNEIRDEDIEVLIRGIQGGYNLNIALLARYAMMESLLNLLEFHSGELSNVQQTTILNALKDFLGIGRLGEQDKQLSETGIKENVPGYINQLNRIEQNMIDQSDAKNKVVPEKQVLPEGVESDNFWREGVEAISLVSEALGAEISFDSAGKMVFNFGKEVIDQSDAKNVRNAVARQTNFLQRLANSLGFNLNRNSAGKMQFDFDQQLIDQSDAKNRVVPEKQVLPEGVESDNFWREGAEAISLVSEALGAEVSFDSAGKMVFNFGKEVFDQSDAKNVRDAVARQTNFLQRLANSLGFNLNRNSAGKMQFEFDQALSESQGQTLPADHPAIVEATSFLGLISQDPSNPSAVALYYSLMRLGNEDIKQGPNAPIYSTTSKLTQALDQALSESQGQTLPANHPAIVEANSFLGLISQDPSNPTAVALYYSLMRLGNEDIKQGPDAPIYSTTSKLTQALDQALSESQGQTLPADHPAILQAASFLGLISQDPSNPSAVALYYSLMRLGNEDIKQGPDAPIYSATSKLTQALDQALSESQGQTLPANHPAIVEAKAFVASSRSEMRTVSADDAVQAIVDQIHRGAGNLNAAYQQLGRLGAKAVSALPILLDKTYPAEGITNTYAAQALEAILNQTPVDAQAPLLIQVLNDVNSSTNARIAAVKQISVLINKEGIDVADRLQLPEAILDHSRENLTGEEATLTSSALFNIAAARNELRSEMRLAENDDAATETSEASEKFSSADVDVAYAMIQIAKNEKISDALLPLTREQVAIYIEANGVKDRLNSLFQVVFNQTPTAQFFSQKRSRVIELARAKYGDDFLRDLELGLIYPESNDSVDQNGTTRTVVESAAEIGVTQFVIDGRGVQKTIFDEAGIGARFVRGFNDKMMLFSELENVLPTAILGEDFDVKKLSNMFPFVQTEGIDEVPVLTQEHVRFLQVLAVGIMGKLLDENKELKTDRTKLQAETIRLLNEITESEQSINLAGDNGFTIASALVNIQLQFEFDAYVKASA